MRIKLRHHDSRLKRKRYLFLLTLIIILAIWNISWRSESSSSSTPVQLLQTSDINSVQVLSTDFIMAPGWGKAPIVVESHKLIFFTIPKVACSVWKQLFRRMEGYNDWNGSKINVHNPRVNGLRYLNQYSLQNATRLINDPTYTKVIFARDPKDRFLSAYLDKGLQQNGQHILEKCCSSDRKCWPQSNRSFAHFFDLTKTCSDTHWNPMYKRLEPKYLPLIDFIGSMDNLQEDSKRLLQTIGAWDQFGASGWGVNGKERVFQSKSSVNHATSNNTRDAWDRMKNYYTPELERAVEERYARDYDTFHLPRKQIEF
jgi:hypothetical protein